jgi:hypothetical protein
MVGTTVATAKKLGLAIQAREQQARPQKIQPVLPILMSYNRGRRLADADAIPGYPRPGISP